MSSLFFWFVYFTIDAVYKAKAVFTEFVILVKIGLQICRRLHLKLMLRFLSYLITIKIVKSKLDCNTLFNMFSSLAT